MEYPTQYRYTKDHEWAKSDGPQITIGITHHAQDQLGDIVFVDLPAVGRKLEAGETFGVVESIKAVSDLYAPLTGTVTEVNEAARAEPAMINRDPHNQGWLIRIAPTDPKTFDQLLDSASYKKLL